MTRVSFDALAGALGAHKDVILERWRAAVTSDPSQPACVHGLRGDELDDHLPSLLEELVRSLCDEETPAVEKDGADHGHQRRGHGYLVTDLLDEVMLFRRILLDEFEKFASGNATPPHVVAEARLRLIDLLDRSIRASVSQYNAETQRERDDALMRLRRTNVELDAANVEKDRFLTMLSHELRNPLAPILSAVTVLQRMGPHDAAFTRQREIIARQARHLTKLVDDLLDVSRIAHGKIELEPRLIELHEPVRLALESCRPGIDARRLHLRVDLTAELLCVFADPTRITQIVTNLLVNATKYTPEGGHVAVTLAREDGEAVLRVRDDGIGLEPHMLARIFDAFAQADTSLHRGTGGLGVGLMVAKSLVERQGGRIEAASAGLGRGAEFTVRLPVALTRARAAAPASAEPPPETPLPSSATPLRIAVVEDNPDSRDALAAGLELMGHEVLSVGDGDAALRLAREQRPHAFIIDIGLPGIDGYAVADGLRQRPESQHAVLVALSGYGTANDKARAREAGFDLHFTKPADFEQLHAAILRAMPA